MKGTEFSSIEELNAMLRALDRLEPDQAELNFVFRLLEAGWEVTPPPHPDEATSSSPVTNPSIFQD
jgi:hypothetical protein